MSKQEILEKAIEKAEKNGWAKNYKIKMTWLNDDGTRRITAKITIDDWDTYAPIIFDHGFAKALWGDELHQETFIVPKELSKRFAGANYLDVKPMWQYHLQQMVLSDDPIKYLGDNLDG